MTTSFFTPPEMIYGDIVRFPEAEAHHASRVVRHRSGDVVRVVDGTGRAFLVHLDSVDDGDVRGRIIETTLEENEPDYRLTLAVGLMKQRARVETMVEKAVELGVSRIVPIVSSRVEKTSFRLDRYEKIVLAALKQSGRSRLTEISEPVAIDEYLRSASASASASTRLICHEKAQDEPFIMELLTEASNAIDILIGPEGGFDEREVASAVSASFQVVHLGCRRLRAETSALFAAACTAAAQHLS